MTLIPSRVDLEDFPRVVEMIVRAGIDELATAGKIEAATDCGDNLAHTQRYRTGRAAKSTAISGKDPVSRDPGPAPNDQLAFYLPASRTELLQQAETEISKDEPADDAHVIEDAGSHPEGEPYPGFLEARYGKGAQAIAKTESNPAVVARASKRAERAFRRNHA